MLFVDLLRLTVLLIAGAASVLGLVTVIAADQNADYAVVYFSGVWWLIAAIGGISLGGSRRSGEAMGKALSAARTSTSLPTESAGRIAFQRLWPIGLFAIVAGGLAVLWPQVTGVGAGFAILNALAWRGRERPVTAVEGRDGAPFYVDPGSALSPANLTRTPGPGTYRPPPRQSSPA